jgi:serine/threonine-protein kinase
MVIERRADNRSDLFSLGAVFYEMLAGERLFSGRNTAEVLERVIAGTIPSPRLRNPEIPEGVTGILRRALQREPARRFASAGEMGEACEHFLYDKGYGPTNLTLKQYLNGLFPDSEALLPELVIPDPEALEPTIVPFGPARIASGVELPALASPPGREPRNPDLDSASPDATPRVRRIRTRSRPR